MPAFSGRSGAPAFSRDVRCGWPDGIDRHSSFTRDKVTSGKARTLCCAVLLAGRKPPQKLHTNALTAERSRPPRLEAWLDIR